jgi:hypothetical protein
VIWLAAFYTSDSFGNNILAKFIYEAHVVNCVTEAVYIAIQFFYRRSVTVKVCSYPLLRVGLWYDEFVDMHNLQKDLHYTEFEHVRCGTGVVHRISREDMDDSGAKIDWAVTIDEENALQMHYAGTRAQTAGTPINVAHGDSGGCRIGEDANDIAQAELQSTAVDDIPPPQPPICSSTR